jgi:Lon protease-like protein
MLKLPLFPLNTVLFPGMPLSLHIFEERYKLMINRCLEAHLPFGVVLIENGLEANGPLAQPHHVGCTARITQVQPLGGGRMNLVAVGQDRFKILSLEHDQPYLVGNVELLPMENDNPVVLNSTGRYLRPWVERYLTMLARAENLKFDIDQLPQDPLSLAYLAAFLVQIPTAQKQDLLAVEGASALMDNVRAIYRREVTLLDAMLAKDNVAEQGPFSLN